MQYISETLTGKVLKHKDLNYVNTLINKDCTLFIDPMLIDVGTSDLCKKAKSVIDDYFNCLYSVYSTQNDDFSREELFKHASEINDNHIGYGKRLNGKGNTEDGMIGIFSGVEDYINRVKLSKSFELVLYVPGFAEDGMSDLLTNILYIVLSEFTIEQCNSINHPLSTCNAERFYWNTTSHSWARYIGQSLIVNGKPVLLIPKEIVQTKYRFTVDNYLRSVIVENICKERAIIDAKGDTLRPPKNKVREELIKEYGTPLNAVISATQKSPDSLQQYYPIIQKKYSSLTMSDDELDNVFFVNQANK